MLSLKLRFCHKTPLTVHLCQMQIVLLQVLPQVLLSSSFKVFSVAIGLLSVAHVAAGEKRTTTPGKFPNELPTETQCPPKKWQK